MSDPKTDADIARRVEDLLRPLDQLMEDRLRLCMSRILMKPGVADLDLVDDELASIASCYAEQREAVAGSLRQQLHASRARIAAREN